MCACAASHEHSPKTNRPAGNAPVHDVKFPRRRIIHRGGSAGIGHTRRRRRRHRKRLGLLATDAVKAANQSTTANTPVGACTPTGTPNGGGHGYNHGNVILLAAGSYIFTAPDNFWYGPNALPPVATDIVIVGAPDGSVIERGTLGTPPFRLFYVGGGQSLTDYNAGNLPGCDPDPNAATCKLPGPGSLTLVKLSVRNGLAKGGDNAARDGGGGAFGWWGFLPLAGLAFRRYERKKG